MPTINIYPAGKITVIEITDDFLFVVNLRYTIVEDYLRAKEIKGDKYRTLDRTEYRGMLGSYMNISSRMYKFILAKKDMLLSPDPVIVEMALKLIDNENKNTRWYSR